MYLPLAHTLSSHLCKEGVKAENPPAQSHPSCRHVRGSTGKSFFFNARQLRTFRTFRPGLPDFSLFHVPKWEKNVPNDHKVYQRAIKYSKWPEN
jgi:hypothetical protein